MRSIGVGKRALLGCLQYVAIAYLPIDRRFDDGPTDCHVCVCGDDPDQSRFHPSLRPSHPFHWSRRILHRWRHHLFHRGRHTIRSGTSRRGAWRSVLFNRNEDNWLGYASSDLFMILAIRTSAHGRNPVLVSILLFPRVSLDVQT